MPIAIMMLQVSAAQPLPPIRFDLAKAGASAPAPGCHAGKGDEITVCGKRNSDRYGVKPLAGAYADKHVSAEAMLPAGVKAAAHGEKTPLPGGGPPRFMLSLTKPF